jgi:hypothetical protein
MKVDIISTTWEAQSNRKSIDRGQHLGYRDRKDAGRCHFYSRTNQLIRFRCRQQPARWLPLTHVITYETTTKHSSWSKIHDLLSRIVKSAGCRNPRGCAPVEEIPKKFQNNTMTASHPRPKHEEELYSNYLRSRRLKVLSSGRWTSENGT